MKNINVECVDCNRKSITRLMIETTVSSTDHYQDGNRCRNRDPYQDGDVHAGDQDQQTSLIVMESISHT